MIDLIWTFYGFSGFFSLAAVNFLVMNLSQNIIIRMPNWIGDAVMATPLIADLRHQFPEAQITAMCQGKIGELLLANPHLNEIFTFSRPNEFIRYQATRQLIARLRQGKYDLGLLLPNSLSSAWWFWRGAVKERIGFATDGRSLLLTRRPPLPKERGEHLVLTYKRLLQPLEIAISTTKPQLFVTKEEMDAAALLLAAHKVPLQGTVIGINPGAAFGAAKCWPKEKFRALAKKILEKTNAHLLFFGDAQTAPLVHEICANLPSRVVNLAGLTSLRELIALLKQCSLFLTNDSGPMHIAAALQVPLVALFGSTDPFVTGPYQHGTIIRKDNISCAPCFRRVCPIDFRCMQRIEVDEVYSVILSQCKS
jgi:heptosyltransferase II